MMFILSIKWTGYIGEFYYEVKYLNVLTGIITMYVLGIIFSYSFFAKQWYISIITLVLIFVIIINQHFKKRNIVFFLFFLLSVFSYFTSINTNFSNKIWVYVAKESKYGYIAKYKNLTVYLNGDFDKLNGDFNESLVGKNLLVEGTYNYKKDGFKGVLGSFKVSEIIKSENTLNFYINNYKAYIHERFQEHLGEKNTSYVMALVFGESKFIDEEDKEELKTLGILHVLSVSGFHMVLIFGLFRKFFNVKTAILLTFFYLLLTGVENSSLRAFIMIFIAKMSTIFHRNYNSRSALYFAALVILIMNPFSLFNIGFLLSFGATLGILMYQKKFSELLPSFLFKFNEELSLTISAQVFILPILWLTFGGVNTIFLIGNILLIPFYTIIIYLSCLMFLVLNFNFIVVPIAKIINALFYSLEGAKRFLLNIDMPILDFDAEANFLYILVFILITYIVHTKKYRNEAIVLITSVFIFTTFKFFPEATIYQNHNYSAVYIQHLNDKYLFANFDEIYGTKVAKLKSALEKPITITNFKKVNTNGGVSLLSKENTKYIDVIYRNEKLSMVPFNEIEDYDIITKYKYKYIFGKWWLMCKG